MFSKRVQYEKGFCISFIRSDYGGEFENHIFEIFCIKKGISHNFSHLRTSQQNGVVESKNISYYHIFGSECFIVNTKDKVS